MTRPLLATLLIAAALLTGCAQATGIDLKAVALSQGPEVDVINNSNIPVQVRFWVAVTDVREDAGFRDQRTGDHLAFTSPPDSEVEVDCGRAYWATAYEDAVIWVRLQPLPPDADPGPLEWFELPRPAPRELRIEGWTIRPGHTPPMLTGPDGEPIPMDLPPTGITYELDDDRSLKPLPRSIWIERHDGVFPIRGE